MEENIPRCSVCSRAFIKAWDDISGEISGHLWEPDCEHYPKGITLSIG